MDNNQFNGDNRTKDAVLRNLEVICGPVEIFLLPLKNILMN